MAEENEEKITALEYIGRAVEALERAEHLRREAQRKLSLGQHPGDATEFNRLKAYFDRLAAPIVLAASAEGIDATGLDQFIRTGNPAFVEAAFQVLRRMQGWALKKFQDIEKAKEDQQAVPPTTKKPKSTKPLIPSYEEDACLSYAKAIEENPSLAGKTLLRVHAWIKEVGVEIKGEKYILPPFSTWTAHLRHGRQKIKPNDRPTP